MGSENYPQVSIIIVNWNGYKNIKECLISILKCSYPNFEIIIVDNGSVDRSVSYIKNMAVKYGNIRLIENKKNVGYAEGNNLGFKRAKGKMILFLNNDTLVDKDFLNILVNKLISDKSIGAVQPKILNYPKSNIIDSVGSYFLNTGFLYHFGHNKKDHKRYQTISEIFSMKGACMLFKKSVINKIGLFENNYFAYFEETDLCHRAILAGYTIYYVPSAVIYHKGGGTASKLPSEFIQFHSYKNRIYTYLKNFELLTIIKILPIHITYCLLISSVYFFTFKFSLSYAILKAIGWNIMNLKMIKKKRKEIQRLRKSNDNIYLSRLTRKVGFNYYYHLFATSLAGYRDKS